MAQSSADDGAEKNGRGNTPSPDVLLIGHVTCDLVDAASGSECRLGGTVSFAAVTADRLGRRPTVITRAGPNTDFSELPSETELYVLPSEATTTFANVYTPQGRVQYTYAQAAPIAAADIPTALRRPSAVLLGPLVGEIDADIAPIFAESTLKVAVPQGWMRQWDEQGRITSRPWANADMILPYLDVLVLSLEDINFDLGRLDSFFSQVSLVALTEYRDGSTIYRRLEDATILETKIPPRPAREVDPTGAGDIFATAFMIRLQETGDPYHAARFANVTASFGVEQAGVRGIPRRQQVLAYMEQQPFTPIGV